MKNFKYLIVFIGLTVTSTAAAQGHLDIEQKWLYRALFNPAATGNTNTLDLYGIAHEQWTGVAGAPSVQLLYGHYLFQNANLGVGFGVINESIGFYHTLDLKASFAYHIPLTSEFTLSLGLSPIVNWTFRNDADISFDYPEIAVAPPFESRTDINFDAGVELRHQWFKLGISALRLIEQKENPISYRSFMSYGVSRFGVTEHVDLSPVLAGTLDHTIINGEAGMMFFYKRQSSRQQLLRLHSSRETYDFLWGGLLARTSGDVSVLAGVGITEHWRLGYAFRYSFQYQSEYSPSSHEILLSWRIPISNATRYYNCEDC